MFFLLQSSKNHNQTFAYTCTKWPKKEVIRNTYAYDVISGNSHYTHSTYEN